MAAGPTIYRFPRKKLPAVKPESKEKRRWEKMRKQQGKNTRLPPGAKN
jgi:hypothetical protein